MDLRALSSGGGRQAAAKLIGNQIQAGGQRRLAKGKTTPCDSLDRGGRRQIGQVELTLKEGKVVRVGEWAEPARGGRWMMEERPRPG